MTDHRGTFRPEPVPAVPPSERGHFEVAPEPGRPGQFRLWLYGDGGQRGPRSILLTLRDVRGLCVFLADVESGGRAIGQLASTAARPPPPRRGRSGAAGGASPLRWAPGPGNTFRNQQREHRPRGRSPAEHITMQNASA
jgi:hypothetical protein